MALPVHRDVALQKAGADVDLVNVELQRRRLLRAGGACSWPVARGWPVGAASAAAPCHLGAPAVRSPDHLYNNESPYNAMFHTSCR